MCVAYGCVVALIWTERGGPKVVTPLGPGGYGSRPLTRAMTNQLNDSIMQERVEAGIIVTLRMKKTCLAT